MSPLACLAALLSALLYFLAFARPPAPVGSDEGSMVMPVKSLHTLLLAGAGGAAPAGAAASATPVTETAATQRTRINLRILWCSLLEDVPKDDVRGAVQPEYRLLISADLGARGAIRAATRPDGATLRGGRRCRASRLRSTHATSSFGSCPTARPPGCRRPSTLRLARGRHSPCRGFPASTKHARSRNRRSRRSRFRDRGDRRSGPLPPHRARSSQPTRHISASRSSRGCCHQKLLGRDDHRYALPRSPGGFVLEDPLRPMPNFGFYL